MSQGSLFWQSTCHLGSKGSAGSDLKPSDSRILCYSTFRRQSSEDHYPRVEYTSYRAVHPTNDDKTASSSSTSRLLSRSWLGVPNLTSIPERTANRSHNCGRPERLCNKAVVMLEMWQKARPAREPGHCLKSIVILSPLGIRQGKVGNSVTSLKSKLLPMVELSITNRPYTFLSYSPLPLIGCLNKVSCSYHIQALSTFRIKCVCSISTDNSAMVSKPCVL